ncbi:MAG: pitrilysin family protein [Actinomycetota bacterium]
MPDTPTIAFTDEHLDNGLRLILAEDHLAPVVAVNLWYDVGSKHEEPDKTGLAHLFEHMMFQGSRNVAKGEHFKFIEAAGGALNASTWLHRTNYFESGPSACLELFLWLEADRMGGLLDALGQETLDNQRDVVKNEKRQRYDDAPYGNWWPALIERLFPHGHPYHHPTIGSMQDLDAATVDDCHAFFEHHYAPNNAVLTLAGDFDPEQARAWVREYFGGIPANMSLRPAPAVPNPAPLQGPVRDVLPDRVPLTRMFAGYRSPPAGTREADAIEVAAAILSLGGGASSKGTRLYRELVREKRLAQDVEFWTMEFETVSVAGGSATLRPGVAVEDLEAEFFGIVEGLAESITEDEIDRARAGLEHTIIRSRLLRASSRADWLSECATMFGDPGRVNDRIPDLLSVGTAEVAEAARNVFRPENRVEIVFVPEEAAK